MKAATATIIGASGLIGSHLVQLLLKEDIYKTIRLLVRKPLPISHPKIEMRNIDFSIADDFKNAIAGSNVVFCAVGTTQKKVQGDKAAYRKVDYDIPVEAAQYCEETGCPQFLLVSSVGAHARSNNFYLKLKGEVEDAITKKNIRSISIFRPSILLGKRKENRLGEKVGKAVMQTFSFLLPSKYKPIQANDVARAMIKAAKYKKEGVTIYQFKEMMELSKDYSTM